MDYFLTDQQKEIQKLARKIAEKDIRPVAARYDVTGEFPWPIVKLMGANDLFRVFIDESHEGLSCGSPILNTALVMEEIAKACASTALIFAGTVVGTLPIIIAGITAIKQNRKPITKYAVLSIRNETLGFFSMVLLLIIV